jgi:hypothetical protein
MIAGDVVSFTLELRLDNGKLVKAYHDDPDPKNSITLSGAGLESKDYTITRGCLYGTYYIQFSRTLANYEFQ